MLNYNNKLTPTAALTPCWACSSHFTHWTHKYRQFQKHLITLLSKLLSCAAPLCPTPQVLGASSPGSLVVSLHIFMQGIHTILATGSQLLTDIIVPTSCQICLLLWCCLVWLLSFCLCLLQQGKYILCFFSIWLCYCCCAVYFSLSTQCVCGSREGEVLSAPLPWPDWARTPAQQRWKLAPRFTNMPIDK